MSHLHFAEMADRTGKHRTVWGGKNGRQIQEKVMANDYTVVSPNTIAERLTAEGFDVQGVGAMGGGWQEALVVRTTAPPRAGYIGEVSILLNNTGRSSILIRRGVVRHACANSFSADDCIRRIRHDTPDAKAFLGDPAVFVQDALNHTAIVAERVESLRGIGSAGRLIQAVKAKSPRVAKALWNATEKYREASGGWSFWSALQGLTDASVPFAVGRANIMTQLLTEANLGVLTGGQVPELN